MAIRIGINGFGRIGRTLLRVLAETGTDDITVVAINDPAPAEALAHLLEFDSVHGRFPHPVTLEGDTIRFGKGPVRISGHQDPANLPWGDIDIALECSGHFTRIADAERHFQNGSGRVLLSAPARGDGPTVVYGVNHDRISSDDRLISNGSCTTNCLAPVAKVLHDAFGITRGMMTTVHCYTTSQPVHDAPHADLYRGRAAALSMIPTSTGAAETMGLVIPELDGLITGQAIRVPAPNVSCIDLSVDVSRAVTVEEVNDAVRTAANGPMRGIIGITDRKLVSQDFARDPHSAIFATDQTRVQSGTLVRVLAWYDNEWGFSCRLRDMIRVVAATNR
ncbi:type I glyceraldehyde-3-phosphate dehydrogenase [uncultured Roseobacter sp.]|uniref:type I glyceraldehyde-3-phosphate dehydrogenase n=1 Tax=uncultured Roseobacter sp. TaxID=114847 RepID=UPI00261AE3F8|nr:type I glyceraldehyde-3-phosphate dehydrogenase [uncultured Roseobacter sp.]